MPTIDALIVAAIVIVFVAFGAVLAWGEYQTRHLNPPARLGGREGGGTGSTTLPAPKPQRNAA